MTDELQVARVVDAKGELCPMPVVRLRLAIDEMQPGQRVRLLATDPGARKDVPAFCEMTGHKLLQASAEEPNLVFVVQKV